MILECLCPEDDEKLAVGIAFESSKGLVVVGDVEVIPCIDFERLGGLVVYLGRQLAVDETRKSRQEKYARSQCGHPNSVHPTSI